MPQIMYLEFTRFAAIGVPTPCFLPAAAGWKRSFFVCNFSARSAEKLHTKEKLRTALLEA
jgi:hypothetical protein